MNNKQCPIIRQTLELFRSAYKKSGNNAYDFYTWFQKMRNVSCQKKKIFLKIMKNGKD